MVGKLARHDSIDDDAPIGKGDAQPHTGATHRFAFTDRHPFRGHVPPPKEISQTLASTGAGAKCVPKQPAARGRQKVPQSLQLRRTGL